MGGAAAATGAAACRDTARPCSPASRNGARAATYSPNRDAAAVSRTPDVHSVAVADANPGLFSSAWSNAHRASRRDPHLTNANANFAAPLARNVAPHRFPRKANAWRTIRCASAASAGACDACVQTNPGGSGAANEPCACAARAAAVCGHGR